MSRVVPHGASLHLNGVFREFSASLNFPSRVLHLGDKDVSIQIGECTVRRFSKMWLRETNFSIASKGDSKVGDHRAKISLGGPGGFTDFEVAWTCPHPITLIPSAILFQDSAGCREIRLVSDHGFSIRSIRAPKTIQYILSDIRPTSATLRVELLKSGADWRLDRLEIDTTLGPLCVPIQCGGVRSISAETRS
jgi:hypothetical protein